MKGLLDKTKTFIKNGHTEKVMEEISRKYKSTTYFKASY